MAWHDATCATLDLEWEDGQPGCRKCERKAPKLAPVHPISPPAPPPDTPRSELICTWPPSVFSQGQAGGHEDSDTLARLLANIDEWTGTSSTRPSQRELKSDQRSPQQQPLNPSEPNFLFQGIYSRLPNANSIRLLRLHGSEDINHPICGALEIYQLDDPCRPVFEAFSYTWADSRGDSSLSKTIFLSPHYDVLPVTTNCLASLRRFRTSIDRLIWVDAICINQYDLRERGHQVSLMRDIFTSAARVLTYLGGSDHAVKSAIVLPQKDDRLPGQSSQRTDVDISAILRMPYFSRIWVIQEVMLSKAASVALGNHAMHLKDLLSNVNSLPPASRTELPGNWLEHFGKEQGNDSLFSLLLATRNCHCGDLRDRVYGLMGLITENEREKLPVDYNISVQQLYTGLAAFWLTGAEGQWQAMHYKVLQLASCPKTIPYLPSWVPDWTPQLHVDGSRGYAPSTSMTFWFDTTHVQKSSGLGWPLSSNSFLHGWALDETSWSTCHDSFESTNGYLRLVRGLEWMRLSDDIPEQEAWRRIEQVEFLPKGGALALDAVHILSTSLGKVEFVDKRGKLLPGLQLISPGELGPEEGSFRQHDIHLYFLPSWKVAVALRKQSDTIYSLHGLSRIVSAPLGQPVPLGSKSMSDIYKNMKHLERDIVGHWLLDFFFHATNAGPAYTHIAVRLHWTEHLHESTIACRASAFSCNTTYHEIHQQSIIETMMEIRQDVLDFFVENRVPDEIALDGRLDNPSSSVALDRRHEFPYTDDKDLATLIYKTRATQQHVASSPEEICAYLRSIVKDQQDFCKDYVPIQTALSDISDGPPRLFIWIDKSNSLRHVIPLSLVPDSSAHSRNTVAPVRSCRFTYAFIVWKARSLLSDLIIDPKFTLEENFNVLWTYVLTMEMVARLRGVLQQHLILRAIRDKTMNVQKIHIV
ncbi:unnamed protein product [Alternaria burnsii]|nr:unnamed protein product [Alternaria burnsii]